MNEVDLEGDGSGYSGTFRWKSTKVLGHMPTSSNKRLKLNFSSWMKYFSSRCESSEISKQLIQTIQNDLSYIDCLSFPLSICYLIENSVFGNELHTKNKYKKITLVCMGCSSKAEERVLRETNCFLELCYYFFNVQHIELWLVGPEMSCTIEALQTHTNVVKNQLFVCSIFKGSSVDFFRQYPSHLNKHTVVVGLNCGFGNYENPTISRFDLLLSWLPDLYFLTGTALPILFTCANDYADLHGETTIMRNILGAHFILAPRENPFSFASTMVPPVAQQQQQQGRTDEYARGNSFCYGVQGSDRSRRHKIAYEQGRLCIPQFLALFNGQQQGEKEDIVIPCRLQLEVIQVSKPKKTEELSPALMYTGDVPSVEPAQLSRTPDVNEQAVVDVQRTDGQTNVIIPTSDEIHEVSSALQQDLLIEHSPEVIQTSSVPQQAIEQNITSEQLAQQVIAPPILHSLNCIQVVGAESLTVKIAFACPIAMNEIELLVGEEGTVLLLELKSTISSEGGGATTESHKIQLQCRVVPNTLAAKFSKKKNTLTLTAQIVI